MRKILIILILLLPALAYAQPSIKIGSDSYNFGDVTSGAQLEHVFEIKNNGTEVLVIKKVTGS